MILLKPFTKPAKTFDEQCDLLIRRGMLVPDREKTVYYLSHISYYRLEAYWLPYETSRKPHQFAEGACFDTVLSHYLFDRQLRLLLLDAIERFEVSFRTQWAYCMSHAFGPHGYLEGGRGLVKDGRYLSNAISDLEKHLERSDEAYIKHYRDTYQEKFPPAWVSCEVMSLGLLSRFYSNLRAYKVRREIAASYQFDEGFFDGFLEHISYVRNVCAHHSRLWNRHLTKKMPLPRGKPASLKDNIYIDDGNKTEHKLYNTLVLLQHVMTVVCPETHWAKKLDALIEEHGIDVKRMGFPEYWKTLPLWVKALDEQ